MNFLENITFRRTRTKSDSILNDSDAVSALTINETGNSVPDLSEDEDVGLLKELREQVMNLTIELQSARAEIEALVLENNDLRSLNNPGKNNYIYETMNDSSPKLELPTTKKSVKNNKQSKKQSQVCTLENKNPVNTNKAENKQSKKQSQVCTLENKNPVNTNKAENKSKNPELQKSFAKRRKVCILSTDNNNKITDIAEDTFIKCDICHYITPHSKMQHLLSGIRMKLSNFTLQDYCIILLGEEDFKVTNRYLDCVLQIREVLQEISHTNVIICTPTYKFFNNNYLFNSRIETFNNLLYLDILTHGHAYFLDSNKNLRYDDTMFDRRTGRINDFGMHTIFKDIKNMITFMLTEVILCAEDCITNSIECKETDQSNVTQGNNSEFFLL